MTRPCILIPAYKPDIKMIDLVRCLKMQAFQSIVIVDDGGGPFYQALFSEVEALGCSIVHQSVNMGKGRALKTGINYCLVNGLASHGIITADADGQHTPEDICKIARAMQENPETLVLGVRNFKGCSPLKNRLGNGITRLLFAAINGKVVHDTQTGLRGLPPVHLPLFLSLAGERYEYEMNMLLAIRQNGIALCQVPIDTIYIEGNRSSHFNVWLDSFRIYRLILKYILSSASSAAIDYLVFALLNATLPGQLIYSVVVARIASSLVNFSVNRKLVFKHHGSSKRCFVRYYLLVSAVMLCSYALIKLFHEMLGLNIFAAKGISDILLFVVSFFIQREFVYKKAPDTQPESDPEGW